jgi:serine/threonine protein kinase
LFLQLCGAVAYVHSHLILHRDLKPGNVMVTAGSVKLLDFGTLKRVDVEAADSLMTRAGIRSVTLRYASPEYLAGLPVTTATDVYSLGVVLYRILSGRAAGHGHGAAATYPPDSSRGSDDSTDAP